MKLGYHDGSGLQCLQCYRQFVFLPENRRGRPQMPLLKPMRCCAYFWFQWSRTGLDKIGEFYAEGHGRGGLRCDRFQALAAAFPVNHSGGSCISVRNDDLAPSRLGPEYKMRLSHPTERTLGA